MKLETKEQCEYYAGVSATMEGNLIQAQRVEPVLLIVEGEQTDGKTEENNR